MRQSRRRAPLLVILLISAAALAYELLLTRIFAIVHWHHLVTTAISLALLGYGASGTFLTVAGRSLQRHFAAALITNAALFGVTTVACVWVAQRIPFDPQALLWDPRQAGWLAAMLGALAMPFFAAANCIGLVLTTYREQIPRIYGVDLLGAAIGALALSAAVTLLPPSGVLLGIMALGLGVAVLAASQLHWHRGPVMALAVAILMLTGLSGAMRIQTAAYKDLSRAMLTLGAVIDHHRDGVSGMIDVVRNDAVPNRHAPGLSLHSGAPLPPQLAVFTDGDATGTISDYDGLNPPSPILGQMLSALPYRLFEAPSVAVLAAAMDHRVRQALELGASHISAIEHDQTRQAVNCDTYLDLNRRSCASSTVSWERQTARGFGARRGGRFDLISLVTDAEPGGLDALNIDYALTREALVGYLRRLTPGGVIALEAPTRVPPGLSLRLLVTAAAALRDIGVQRAADHIALLRGWQRFSLLLSNHPLDPPQLTTIRRFADDWGFDLVWLPDIAIDEVNRFQQLQTPIYHAAAARILGAVEQESAQIDLRPVTDDRPYPHRASRWSGLVDAIRQLDGERLRQVDNALVVAALTLLFAIVSSVLLIMLPLTALRRGSIATPDAGIKIRALGYFALLGPAFLFTEIAWIQHLELFLDRPLYAASIALAVFLSFAGLGSLWVQRFDETATGRLLWAAVAVIVGFAAVFAFTSSTTLTSATTWSLPVRLLLAILLLAPLAFAMGIPFAAGLRRFGGISPQLIPWAWGINGCASVISAAGASILAPDLGFRGLVAVAAVAYLLLPTLRPAPDRGH